MPSSRKPTLLAVLAAVFFFSGSSSLLYQVAWQRLLTVYYGVGPISSSLIVSVYMLGLGMGALVGGRLAERIRNRLALYLGVEIALGIFGLASPLYLDLLGRATAGSSYRAALAYMLAFLAVPTFLMGTTLPIIVKVFTRMVNSFVDSVGYLYFLNTLGAAFGAVIASYGVISFFGLAAGTRVAAAINFLIALVVYVAYRSTPRGVLDPPERQLPEDASRAGDPTNAGYRIEGQGGAGRLAFLFVFVTGFLAIGYEVAWFRIVEVLVKASPYAFSTVLFVYLSGIAFGSLWMGRVLRHQRVPDKVSLFFLLQFLIGAYVAVSIPAYYHILEDTAFGVFSRASFAVKLHPSFEIAASSSDSGVALAVQWFAQLDILIWPAFFVFVPTFLMGAGFPLISLLALGRSDREGQVVGAVYFFNTLGNMLGGLVTGLVLLPTLGTERTLMGFAAMGIVMGFRVSRAGAHKISRAVRAVVVTGLVTCVAILFPAPGALYEAMHLSPGDEFELTLREGIEGIVATYRDPPFMLNYLNGLGHGGRPGYLFLRETVEALAYAEQVDNVLVIGFGTGAVTETVLRAEGVEHVTMVELNDTLMRTMNEFPEIESFLRDPRLEVLSDDGRRFLLRTEQRFDLVLIDPLRTTTAYSNNLYSREFFELVESRLKPGGVFMVWMDEFQVLPRTIAAVFHHMRMYNYFSLASNAPLELHAARRERLMAQFSDEERDGIDRCDARFVANRQAVLEATDGFPINEDWRPVCEYYLGLRSIRAGLTSALDGSELPEH